MTNPLRDFILSRTRRDTGVPMALFTAAALRTAEDHSTHPADGSGRTVEEAAAELGVDLDANELFGYDAYRVQSRLGELLLPDQP